MKIAYLFLVFIHGLIHILGFIKGFGFKDIKELTLPISKPLGVLWLLATILFFIYGILYLNNNKYTWLIGFIAVLISQILVFIFWKDAKFGTLPNVLILLVSIISYGNFHFQKLVTNETNDLLSQTKINTEKIVSTDDIIELPKPVQKWLKQSGVIGKPIINVGKVLQKAHLKMKPEQENWLEADAIQYSTIDVPQFIWSVDVKMNPLMYFKGRDKFTNGKGEMMIKLNSLFNVVNEKGTKLNEGTMQRYLGEMVWFPSLALSKYITWQAIDDTTAIATMNYKGTSGEGIFYFNSQGDFIKFSAMRFKGNEPDSKKYEWILEVQDYDTFQGIKVPSKMTATWILEDKNWTWLKLEIKDILYNEQVL